MDPTEISTGMDPAADDAGPTGTDPREPSGGLVVAPRPSARGWRLAIFLFLVTCATTLLTGVMFEAPSGGSESLDPFQRLQEVLVAIMAQPSLVLLGVPYASCILAILGTHEMGHYIACRKYGIDATPPYFLPSPPGGIFGTFGAFIRIRAPITDRKALFDIGVAGPLAGFAVAVPVMILGITMSGWRPEPPGAGGYAFGDCLLVRALTDWLAAPPPAPTGYVFEIGSVAMAGWVGLLATALNLLPVGQLDGGHIAYALSRRFHTIVSRLCLAGFVVLGLWINESWLFWATVLVFLSPRHPLLQDESRPLSPARLAVAILAGLILLVSFIPSPIRPLS